MIKFFRRIRQKLLVEGNLKRYLVYALGEVVLVMIGILLAIQINNWYEGRKNFKAETVALIELKNEFDRNYNSFLRVFDAKQKAEENLHDYLSFLNDDSKTIAQKAKIERGNVAIFSWDPGNAVLNSLLSTGNIEHIKNDSLKYLLHDWNRVVYEFNEQAIAYKTIVYELYNYEKLKKPIKMVKKGQYNKGSERSQSYIKHTNLELQEFRKQFVDDFRYHNLLINCVNGLYSQIMEGYELKKEFNQIRYLLDEEIKLR